MRRTTSRRPALAALLLASAAAVFGACAHEDYSYTAAKEIQDNATPNLDTLSQRRIDIDNTIAVTFDTNGRLLNEDLGRMFFFDRPSRLTPAPMPH